MSAWQIWMIIGIICVVIEIFDPAFFFISLGAAAIITGLLSLSPAISVPFQIIIFVILSFIAFLSMRKLGKRLLKVADKDTNVYALKGQPGVITREIPAGGRGYVKVGGEEWSAVEKNGQPLQLQDKVTVTGIDGNKLIVEKSEGQN